jgi:F-type H+-transporting ATPase subunit gamma
MANLKDIRRRIKSINNTAKITRAMEMVSASKMRKATESVLAIRDYAHSAWNILGNLSRAFEKYDYGLLEVRPVKKVLVIIITSNRGLCGSFNSQIIKKVIAQIEDPKSLAINRAGKKKIETKIDLSKIQIDFVTVGRKGENLVRRLRKEIIATFPEMTYLPNIENMRPLSKIVIDEYLAKKYDKVVVAYTDFVSVISQEPKIRQLLPVSKIDLEKQITDINNLAEEYNLNKQVMEYKVEPSPRKVLKHIFPRLIEMQLYHAILESNASKASARMMAMRNATDSAKEIAGDLTLMHNKIRQMKITQEISEISAGRTALE